MTQHSFMNALSESWIGYLLTAIGNDSKELVFAKTGHGLYSGANPDLFLLKLGGWIGLVAAAMNWQRTLNPAEREKDLCGGGRHNLNAPAGPKSIDYL